MKCFVLVGLLFSIPFGLLFSNWPSLLSSVLLCVVPASALSLSPREGFDVSPLCRRPLVPWLVDSRRGWRGQCGSGWGMKGSGAVRGHLHTEPCLCVCFIFNCFPWPQTELLCQRPSHGRCDLPLPVSPAPSIHFPFLSHHISLFSLVPFRLPALEMCHDRVADDRWNSL